MPLAYTSQQPLPVITVSQPLRFRPIHKVRSTTLTEQQTGREAVLKGWKSACIERISALTEGLILPAGSYTVRLVVDVREQKANGRNDVVAELGTFSHQNSFQCSFADKILLRNVDYTQETLPLADYAWIAESKNSNGMSLLLFDIIQRLKGNQRLMLNTLVERKRRDDLAASIKGRSNRYLDQKARMRGNGIEHIVFLIEKEPKSASVGLPEATLLQASINTQVFRFLLQNYCHFTIQIHDGMHLVQTASATESAAYLTSITRRLQQRAQTVTLIECSRANIEEVK